MNTKLVIMGVLLTVLGLFLLAGGSFTYTKREKVIDVGPVQVTQDKEKTFPLQPIAGAIALAGGIMLLLTPRK